jgi:hypothetical protein
VHDTRLRWYIPLLESTASTVGNTDASFRDRPTIRTRPATLLACGNHQEAKSTTCAVVPILDDLLLEVLSTIRANRAAALLVEVAVLEVLEVVEVEQVGGALVVNLVLVVV